MAESATPERSARKITSFISHITGGLRAGAKADHKAIASCLAKQPVVGLAKLCTADLGSSIAVASYWASTGLHPRIRSQHEADWAQKQYGGYCAGMPAACSASARRRRGSA